MNCNEQYQLSRGVKLKNQNQKSTIKPLHEQLFEARLAANLMQKEVGIQLGAMDGRWLNDIERGRRKPSLRRVQQLAEIYGATFIIGSQ